MKRQIKMIGLDCDGTLLNNNKELPEYSRNVLLRAIDEGIVVLVATGRPVTGIPKQMLDLPGTRYALTSNGARIVDLQEDKVLYESTMPLETAKKVLAVFEKYDTYKEVFLDGTGYCNVDELSHVEEYTEMASVARYMKECRVPVKDIWEFMEKEQKSVDKVHAIFRNHKEREEAFQEIQSMEGVTPTGALTRNIEVNAKGVNKGIGLLRLGEMLGIKREEIMACGDGMNDYEMLREVGFGVAVENAVEEVKKVADYITDTNENEGVAKAIEQFVFEQGGV